MRPSTPDYDITGEMRRLAALDAYGILDTPAEAGFDDIALIASTLCNTPTALVSLVERDRQWFKARVGFEACETPIEQSVCAHALQQHELLIIPDLTADPRTQANTLVTGEPGIRFYAGAPLVTPAGIVIGTVCVLDTVPRSGGLSPDQAMGLAALGRQTVLLLETRAAVLEREHRLIEQRRIDDEVQRSLRASDARNRSAAEAGRVGTFEVDTATGEMEVSAEFCRIFGVPVTATHQAALFESLTVAEDGARRSASETRADGSAPLEVEYRIRRQDDGRLRWISRHARFVRSADQATSQMVGMVRDITDEKIAALRVSALIELGDRLRDAACADAATKDAAQLLGMTLAGSRAGYATIKPGEAAFIVAQDWAADGAASIAGPHPMSRFSMIVDRLERGEMVVVADVLQTDWSRDEQAAHTSLGIRSLVVTPLLEGGRLAAVQFLHDATPRQWSVSELDFVRSVADRTYLTLARLKAEAQQDVLNGELAHRLKNTLSMVQAITRQTLRSVPDRAPVDVLERRLHALGSAHEVLTDHSWHAAAIPDLVEAALLASGQEGRFDMSGPPIGLGPKAALSLSLVLHELATNAVKYGALSVDEGRVDITWRVDGAGDDAILTFCWQERGGPPTREPERRGFGSRLIQAGMLGTGSVALRYTPDGFEAEMQAPLAHVQRS